MNYASNIISYLNQSYDILKNYQLINKTLSSIERPSDVVEVCGVLDVMSDGFGFLRFENYSPSVQDMMNVQKKQIPF